MGRRPVTGRQGGGYHAATLPDEVSDAGLRVRQVRSGIGHPQTMRRTLRALGLRHHQDDVVVRDTPSVRGMLIKVRHLVEVTPVEDGS